MMLRRALLVLALCAILAHGAEELFGYDYSNVSDVQTQRPVMAEAGEVAAAICVGTVLITIIGLLMFWIVRKYLMF